MRNLTLFLILSVIVSGVGLPTARAAAVTPTLAPEATPSATAVVPAGAFEIIDAVRAENGDADLAYVRAAMARNEAAIAEAKAVLKTSYDAEVRMMAGDSMKLHDTELRQWQAWMRLYGPNPAFAQPPLAAAVTAEDVGVTPNEGTAAAADAVPDDQPSEEKPQ